VTEIPITAFTKQSPDKSGYVVMIYCEPPGFSSSSATMSTRTVLVLVHLLILVGGKTAISVRNVLSVAVVL